MRIAIVQFPGSNCERETILAIERAGMVAIEFLWNESPEKLAGFDGFVIVGGFSYEDRGRAGIIAALDPIMQAIKQQSQLGKPVLGICNGAQILVEAGLVPGLEHNQLGMALTDNKRVQQDQVLGTGYYNAWINMRLSDGYQLNAFTRHLTPKKILHVPVAHAEGRFVIPPVLLAEIERNGLGLFQYCDEQGSIIDAFPVNPNGSVHNIAAITNKAGNVMAMMPHPERTTKGDVIFHSMRDYIAEGYRAKPLTLSYQPRLPIIQKYQAPSDTYTLIVELMITDNQAMSVQNALRHQGISIDIKRTVHWEITCDSPDIFEKIKQSGVLFNPCKEKIEMARENHSSLSTTTFLIRAKEEMCGQEKLQMLKNHFDIQGVHHISQGVLWQVAAPQGDVTEQIIHSHILFNPYAHDCYYY
ncbi:MAG: purQ [Gammaproteobacteria bacterium]|jgi:phosphoribosylformylglycinamidine synthase|nr:purQ [Gammaproteobacteria bacterium]